MTLVTKYKNIQKVFLLLVFVTLGNVCHCSLPVDALGVHVFFVFGLAQVHLAKQLFFFHAPILNRSRVTVHTWKLNLCPDFSWALKDLDLIVNLHCNQQISLKVLLKTQTKQAVWYKLLVLLSRMLSV